MNSCRLLAGRSLRARRMRGEFRNQADRLEIGDRVVERLLVERLAVGVGAGIADQQGVAVGRGLGDALAADGAGGGADIVDDDRLSEQFAHLQRLDARAHVDAAAGRERNHERDRPRRPVLRRRGCGKGGQYGKAGDRGPGHASSELSGRTLARRRPGIKGIRCRRSTRGSTEGNQRTPSDPAIPRALLKVRHRIGLCLMKRLVRR